MAVRSGEERVQVPMSRALGQELKKLAVDLQDAVERDRAMDRGPMLAYVGRWFYSLPQGVQATIVAEGKRLSDMDAVDGVPDVRDANAAYLAGLSRPEWLAGISEAIGEGPDAEMPSSKVLGEHTVGSPVKRPGRKAGKGVGSGRTLGNK